VREIHQELKFSMAAHPRLTVLVIEDETLIRWSIAETLAQRGHTVVEADSARNAVQAIADARLPIDVVLLDFRLPDSSDLGLLSDIRRIQPESAIVMMTAFGTPEMTREALMRGAHTVVGKPFDMNHVESIVLDANQSRARCH
jgi:DNA-binding NtrC family response regulator